MYMLDTNICIYVLKNRTDEIKHKFKVTKNLCISSITYAELCYGIENSSANLKKQRWEQLAIFTQQIVIESFSEDAARHYGRIRSILKSKGTPIGNNDLLIASHALSLNSVLVTNNVSEFKRVPDLTVENWIS